MREPMPQMGLCSSTPLCAACSGGGGAAAAAVRSIEGERCESQCLRWGYARALLCVLLVVVVVLLLTGEHSRCVFEVPRFSFVGCGGPPGCPAVACTLNTLG